MEIRLGHTADWHLGAGTQYGSKDAVSGYNTFTIRQEAALIAMVDDMAAAGCDYMVILGDIFDHSDPSDALRLVAQRVISHAIKKGLFTLLSPGNHDQEDERFNAVMALTLPNSGVAYIDKHSEPFSFENDVSILHIQSDKWPEKAEKAVIGWYHGILAGAKVGDGHELSAADITIPGSCDYIAAGDIHLQQEITPGGVPGAYAGSPFRLNFGERMYTPGWRKLTVTSRGDITSEFRSLAAYSFEFVDTVIGDSGFQPMRDTIYKLTGPSTCAQEIAESIAAFPSSNLYRYIPTGSGGSDVPMAALPDRADFDLGTLLEALPIPRIVKYRMNALMAKETPSVYRGVYSLARVAFSGFGPYRDEQVIDIPQEASIAVTGKVGTSGLNSNGAGKSFIFDAISGCGYGTSYRGLPLGWAVNGAEAYLENTWVGPHTIVIRRTIAKGRGPGKQTLEVMVDGVKQTKDRLPDTQKMIEDSLGVSAATFQICTMVGKPGLSLVDRPSSWRVEYLMDLFKMEDVDRLADFIKTQLTDAENVKRAWEDQIKNAKLEQGMHVIPDPPDPFAGARLDGSIKDARDAQYDVTSKLRDIDNERNRRATHNQQLTSTVNVAKMALDNAQQARDSRQSDMDAANKAVVDFTGGVGGKCPTCGADMSDAHKAQELERLGNVVLEADRLLIRTREQAVAAEATHTTATNNEVTAKLPPLTAENEEELRRDAQLKQTKLSGLEVEKAQWDRQNEDHNQAVRRSAELTQKLVDLGIVFRNFEIGVDYWSQIGSVYDPAAIKEKIVQKVSEFLNTKASYYLSKIFGAAVGVRCDASVKVTSARSIPKFEIFVTRGGKQVPFEQYSSGEQSAVRLSVDLAISELVASTCPAQFKLLIMDEAFDNLDAAKSDAVAELINELKTTRGTCMAVAHKVKIATKFDAKLYVEKDSHSTVTMAK